MWNLFMNAEAANPFQAPISTGTPAASDLLPPKAVKKATNLIRDARLAAAVGLIPVLGLIFILRLVQWYLLRKQFPILVSREPGQRGLTAKTQSRKETKAKEGFGTTETQRHRNERRQEQRRGYRGSKVRRVKIGQTFHDS
jgi:hypothetical protein